jgi:hypothetical protein
VLQGPRDKERTWSAYARLVGIALEAAGPIPEASGHEDDEPGDEQPIKGRLGRNEVAGNQVGVRDGVDPDAMSGWDDCDGIAQGMA